jgi:DNA-directed RNA polymerase subunit RPC12/RpoP
MAGIDQKERYRQRAALCYDIAATIPGDSAIAMRRLADTYAGLAEGSNNPRTGIFVTAKRNDQPQCMKCGKEMRFTYSLPRTDTLRAMQAFRCDGCNETMIWKEK